MSAYTLPNFNLTVSIWDSGHAPPAPPQRTAQGQFYIASKGLFDVTPGDNALWQPPIYLRCPFGTILQVNGYVTVPGGLAAKYRIRWVENIHLGLSNQYVTAILEQA